ETERALQHAIEGFGHNRTLLVIAHRLSTIRAADNIVVLSRGRVIEQGKHDTLMVAHGHYWRLVQAQALGGSADSLDIPNNATHTMAHTYHE
ncbi:MAG: hypothetical protein KDE19_22875, partial [Caldilineaceae bacterium]|nr:hypothetical protein [Caldilineaceae bacterium]